MKIANLVIAIIYTLLLLGIFISAAANNEADAALGSIILTGPVVLNWLSFAKWKK